MSSLFCEYTAAWNSLWIQNVTDRWLFNDMHFVALFHLIYPPLNSSPLCGNLIGYKEFTKRATGQSQSVHSWHFTQSNEYIHTVTEMVIVNNIHQPPLPSIQTSLQKPEWTWMPMSSTGGSCPVKRTTSMSSARQMWWSPQPSMSFLEWLCK